MAKYAGNWVKLDYLLTNLIRYAKLTSYKLIFDNNQEGIMYQHVLFVTPCENEMILQLFASIKNIMVSSVPPLYEDRIHVANGSYAELVNKVASRCEVDSEDAEIILAELVERLIACGIFHLSSGATKLAPLGIMRTSFTLKEIYMIPIAGDRRTAHVDQGMLNSLEALKNVRGQFSEEQDFARAAGVMKLFDRNFLLNECELAVSVEKSLYAITLGFYKYEFLLKTDTEDVDMTESKTVTGFDFSGEMVKFSNFDGYLNALRKIVQRAGSERQEKIEKLQQVADRLSDKIMKSMVDRGPIDVTIQQTYNETVQEISEVEAEVGEFDKALAKIQEDVKAFSDLVETTATVPEPTPVEPNPEQVIEDAVKYEPIRIGKTHHYKKFTREEQLVLVAYLVFGDKKFLTQQLRSFIETMGPKWSVAVSLGDAMRKEGPKKLIEATLSSSVERVISPMSKYKYNLTPRGIERAVELFALVKGSKPTPPKPAPSDDEEKKDDTSNGGVARYVRKKLWSCKTFRDLKQAERMALVAYLMFRGREFSGSALQKELFEKSEFSVVASSHQRRVPKEEILFSRRKVSAEERKEFDIKTRASYVYSLSPFGVKKAKEWCTGSIKRAMTMARKEFVQKKSAE